MPINYMVAPETQQCAVCLRERPENKFRRYRVSDKIVPRPRIRLDEICMTCRDRRRRGALTRDEAERYADVASDNLARTHEPTTKEGKARRFNKERRMPVGLAPYDVAVRELETEWGKPCTQWSLAEDLRCTMRMYELLGWPLEGLASNSPQAQAVKHHRIRSTPSRNETLSKYATHHEDSHDV